MPDAADAIRDAARSLLAWEAIDEDSDTKKRLDEAQNRLLGRSLGRAKADLREAVWRAYRYVYLLGKDNKLRQVDLGQITSSMASSLVELYLNELGRTDEITTGVGANKLLKYWPPALTEWSTKGVRDAFYSSPQLPRLLNPEAIKRTISDGVSQHALGYATKDASGQLKLSHFESSLAEADVEISDEAYILKAEDARKLLEPPQLARLNIRPEHAVLREGERASFTCNGTDQYGQPHSTSNVAWSATGGTISSAGLFTAGDTGGLYVVRAESDGQECMAEVRVTTKDEPPPPPAPPPGMIRWRGSVPTQKWMNFYTKVLTRFASNPQLKLEVTFEVPVDDNAAGKVAETRAGLRELGLDDSVTGS